VTNKLLNEDSQAILLICSSLAISQDERQNVKAYSLGEWNTLTSKLLNSPLKSPKALFNSSEEEWKRYLGLVDSEVDRLKKLINNGAQLAFELDKLSNSGIWITTRAEQTYPKLLKEKLKQKCPIFLYCAGNSSLFKTNGIGIVGSRDIDEKGLEFTKILSEKCTNDGYSIISGGAKGVDSIAQNAALQNDGTVISIVSDSLATKIRSRDYREAILKNKLLMVSAVHPNMTFKAYNAMDRNKFIYTLSQFTVVVSSDYNKGGTWAGATENLKNKWVPVFVRNEEQIPKGNTEILKIGGIGLSKNEVLDKNIVVDKWMEKNNAHKVFEEQITLELFSQQVESKINNECINAFDDVPTSNQNVIQINEEPNLTSKNDDVQEIKQSNETAFDILKPFLLEKLNKEISLDELATIFEVKKTQMQEWVEKLIIEQCVKKTHRPVRYIKA
jgi:predicted Rossmann fold nucleotide-binding protein DprA/Smf involved in DNA uptake